MTQSHEQKSIARRGGRPSRLEAENIALQIVDVARDLFFANGYGATSVETIAKQARISKRTFYHRFENKAAIFRAVVNRLIQRLIPADMDGLFEGKTLEETLQRLAEETLKAALSPHSLALHRLIVAEATRFPEMALVMSEQGSRRDAVARITALLTQDTNTKISGLEATAAAELFMQMVVGLPQRRALGLGTPMTPDELKVWSCAVVQIFLHGIRPR